MVDFSKNKKKKSLKKSSTIRKKSSTSKRDKLKKRREKIASNNSKSDMFFLGKPGTYRMRSVPVEEDMENAVEVIQFYLGPDIKGVISPASLGMPCALEEHYQALKESEDEDDHETAGNMRRRFRYVMPHYRYKDDKGSQPDYEAGVRMLLLTGGLYQDWLDYYLEDEIGDPSDPINGFDIKYKREGSGQFDTSYSLLNCKPSRCDKKFRGPYNPEEILKKVLPSYDQTVSFLERFLGASVDDDDEEVDELREKSTKKKKTGVKKVGKKSLRKKR